MPNRALKQSQRLLAIRTGSGAISLPPQITSISLSFSHRNANGHMGPRKFAQQSIASLQFHNPTVPISVTRVKDPNDLKNERVEALLKIGRADAPEEVVNVQGLHSSDIIKRLIEVTGAVEVKMDEAGAVVRGDP